MGKPHPMELRARVVAFVEEGNSNREDARHFRVSPLSRNNCVVSRASFPAAPRNHWFLCGRNLFHGHFCHA
jgi:hypothetical protein